MQLETDYSSKRKDHSEPDAEELRDLEIAHNLKIRRRNSDSGVIFYKKPLPSTSHFLFPKTQYRDYLSMAIQCEPFRYFKNRNLQRSYKLYTANFQDVVLVGTDMPKIFRSCLNPQPKHRLIRLQTPCIIMTRNAPRLQGGRGFKLIKKISEVNHYPSYDPEVHRGKIKAGYKRLNWADCVIGARSLPTIGSALSRPLPEFDNCVSYIDTFAGDFGPDLSISSARTYVMPNSVENHIEHLGRYNKVCWFVGWDRCLEWIENQTSSYSARHQSPHWDERTLWRGHQTSILVKEEDVYQDSRFTFCWDPSKIWTYAIPSFKYQTTFGETLTWYDINHHHLMHHPHGIGKPYGEKQPGMQYLQTRLIDGDLRSPFRRWTRIKRLHMWDSSAGKEFTEEVFLFRLGAAYRCPYPIRLI